MRHAVMQCARTSLLVVTAACLYGCAASTPDPSERARATADWSFSREAVIIDIAAAPDLNVSERQPHTLALFILQAADPAALRDIDLNTLTGMRSAASVDALPGILTHTLQVIRPGSAIRLLLDRAQQARWVAIVAGYAAQGPQTRTFEIPLALASHGLFRPRLRATPAPLSVQLRLGATAIVDARTGPPTPAPRTDAVPRPTGGKIVHDLPVF